MWAATSPWKFKDNRRLQGNDIPRTSIFHPEACLAEGESRRGRQHKGRELRESHHVILNTTAVETNPI